MSAYGPFERPPIPSVESRAAPAARALGAGASREWVLRSPAGQETVLRLEPGQSLTVGRDLTSDVPILDAGVSRHHATIALERDAESRERLWIEDLHSHNGTFVNTERVQRAEIRAGDVLTFGRVRLTLLERGSAEEEPDPLGKLSEKELALLLRAAREFAGETQQALVFQRLLEISVGALGAERGALFLWDEERKTFHVVAAHPRALFERASMLLAQNVGEMVLRGRRTRLVPREAETPWTLRAGSREETPYVLASPRDPTAPLADGAAETGALAAPIFAGPRPVGVLYLDRRARGGFSAAEARFLHALTWATSTALGTSSQVSDMRAWNQRLEALIAVRRSDAAGPAAEAAGARAAGAVDGGRKAAEATKLLAELESCLEAAGEAAAAWKGEGAGRLFACALQGAKLRLRAIRQLVDRASARLEEVQLAHAFREVSAPRSDHIRVSPERGGELCVSCSPDELFLAIDLALDILCCQAEIMARSPEESALELFWTASPSSDGSAVEVRISGKEPRPRGGTGAEKLAPAALEELSRLLLRLGAELLRRFVAERLRGDISLDGEEGRAVRAIDLRLPTAWISLAETAFLPAHRSLGTAIEDALPEDALPEQGRQP